MVSSEHSDDLIIAGRRYRSRLLTGTGKFKDLEETRGCRRTDRHSRDSSQQHRTESR